MDAKTQSELLKAKEFFYSWRLLEAYAILRRYFDRLPFKPEAEHAEYLGIFVRTLYELGKSQELKFYEVALERHYQKNRQPEIGFQLAYLYCDSRNRHVKLAKEILEEIIAQNLSPELKTKAKFCLAFCYDELYDDTASCRKIIDSIAPPSDPHLSHLLLNWRVKVTVDEGNYADAEEIMGKLLQQVSPESDWYGYFMAKINQTRLYIKKRQTALAVQSVEEMKKFIDRRPAKSLRFQIDCMEALLAKEQNIGAVCFTQTGGENKIQYCGRSYAIEKESSVGKLLLLLARKRFLDKSMIVKTLYQRPYRGEADDKLIYYHVHTLRKQLRRIGLPAEAITNDGKGYRFLPEVRGVES